LLAIFVFENQKIAIKLAPALLFAEPAVFQA